MKKIFFLPIFLSYITISASAQELKTITIKSKEKYPSTKEVFQVLKANDSVRQGTYEKYGNNKLQTTGFYKSNQEDSVWTEFSRGTTVAIRRYSNGNKTGVWEFFDYQGELELTYNSEYDSLLFKKVEKIHNDNKKAFFLDQDGNWKKLPEDSRIPLDLFSSGEYARFLNANLRYPDAAINNNLQGTVWIGITIDELGNPMEYNIEKPVAESLDNEALRIVKLFHGEYIPAIVNGKKVKSKVTRPIVFKLN